MFFYVFFLKMFFFEEFCIFRYLVVLFVFIFLFDIFFKFIVDSIFNWFVIEFFEIDSFWCKDLFDFFFKGFYLVVGVLELLFCFGGCFKFVFSFGSFVFFDVFCFFMFFGWEGVVVCVCLSNSFGSG